MALTAKQKQNILNLKSEINIEILHTCVEALGLVTVSEYAEIMSINRRQVYRLIKNKLVTVVTLSKIIFIVVNDK